MTEETVLEKTYINDEVVAAYNEILFQLQDVKKSIPVDPGEKEKEETIEKLTAETPEHTTQHFEMLRRTLINGIEDIREKYLSEQKKLIDLSNAIETKTKFIKNLHAIEINIDSLSALIQLQSEKKDKFEKEMAEKKDQLNQEIITKQKEWQLEEKEYITERDIHRTKERNQYEATKRALEQELLSNRQKFEKEMAQREARIIENEKLLEQIKQLQEKIMRFPSELDKAKQETEIAITKNLTTNFDYEMQLAKKEMRIYEQTIATLETKISLLESNILRFESLKESFSRLLNPSEA